VISQGGSSRDERLRNDALRLLGVRERSRRELEERLLRKGYPPERVRELLDDFIERGWIDDERFARLFVRERLRRRPRSFRLLDAELAARGVAPEIRRRVLEEARAQVSEQELLARLIRARWPLVSGLGEKGRQRLARWLEARGFASGRVREALESFLREGERSGRGEQNDEGQ
jgi:regulatory protein